MHCRVMSLAVLIGFIAAGQARAQTGAASHPCSLLTTAQISAAVGSVGASREGDMPGTGHGANPLRRACSSSIPGGIFTLSVGKVPNAGLSTRQLLDYVNSMYDLLKGQGWTYEKKDFGSTSCSMLTPPAGAVGDWACADAPIMSARIPTTPATCRAIEHLTEPDGPFSHSETAVRGAMLSAFRDSL